MINQVSIEGNLLADPTFRETEDGRPIGEVTLVHNESWKDARTRETKTRTSYLGVIAHGAPVAELRPFKKGAPVLVIGKLQQEETEPGPRGGKTSKTKIRAQRFLVPVAVLVED